MSNTEKIMLVDLDDQTIGYETKDIVHKKGLLHRAFSVFIVDGHKMLIQKRNPSKYHSGGLWSNACCSHQREKESLSYAVQRRLKEELGINCHLNEAFDFVYRTQFENGSIEYELDHVFIGTYCGEIHADPNEAVETKWVEFEALKQEMLTTPEAFSSWFIISAPRVMLLRTEK